MPAFDRPRLQRRSLLQHEAGGSESAKISRCRTRLRTLIGREIEQVADFLFAKVIGKGPMTHASCIEHWGSDVEACKEFPQ